MNTVLFSSTAEATVWWLSLAVGVVVIVVVALLLTLIVRTARNIEGAVTQIWTVGQQVAANTVHIPMLRQTNQAVDGILSQAATIDGATALIEAHANDCPG